MKAIPVALALVLGVAPLALRGHYLLGVLVLVGIFSLAALGLDLLFGYCGQLSLGQAALMGIGAYASALLTTRAAVSPLGAMLAGTVLAALTAATLGSVVLRLRGYYLVLSTLAGGIIFELFLVGWRDVTGGPSGITGIPPFRVGPLPFTSDAQYYYLVWVLVAISYAGLRNLVSGRSGRAMRAVASDATAASVMGIDVSVVKLKAFVISAVLSAVAGSLYAHYMRFVSPEMVGMQTSFTLVTMAVLGGTGRLWGVLIGVALLKVLPEVIGWLRDYQLLIHGLLLMVMMIRMPQGVAGALASLFARKGSRTVAVTAASYRYR